MTTTSYWIIQGVKKLYVLSFKEVFPQLSFPTHLVLAGCMIGGSLSLSLTDSTTIFFPPYFLHNNSSLSHAN